MPPVLSSSITGYISGDDLSVEVTVGHIPTGRTLAKGWLTIKAKIGDADPGLVQKVITTTPQAGVGQITDNGAGDQTGVLLFLLTPNDTGALLAPLVDYAYDVQVKLDDGTIATIETSAPNGSFRLAQGVTTATS